MLIWRAINTGQLMKRDIWDSCLPETIADIISLLSRRITIHEAWRAFILNDYENAQAAIEAGVGTAESHETYANQYRAAITVLHKIGG